MIRTPDSAPPCGKIQTLLKCIAELRQHPRQAELFPPGPNEAEEIESLADSLRNDGQQYPVEITAGGTIICGHRRVAAAIQLGWSEIQCWVRTDLDEQAVERRHLEDNVRRRQLGPLSRVRTIVRTLEMDHGCPPGELESHYTLQLKAEIAKHLNVGTRHAARYLGVLKAPLEVQQALQKNKISLVLADQLSRRPKAEQQRFVKALRSGKLARHVDVESSRSTAGHCNKSERRLGGLLNALATLQKDEVVGWASELTSHQRDLVRNGLQMLQPLVENSEA